MDTDKLVDAVTAVIMERLGSGEGATATAVAFGDVPAGLLGAGCALRQGTAPSDAAGADYIVLSQEAFRAFHGGGIPFGAALAVGAGGAAGAIGAVGAAVPAAAGTAIDLTGKRLVSERDLKAAGAARGSVVAVGPNAIVTALARDYANGVGAKIARG
jgi:hypothetical protein